MADQSDPSVPEGAAVFPVIPPELEVDPVLLAALHAAVFLDGSTRQVLDPDAAAEVLEYMASYFQRLGGERLGRVREDMECLVAYAQQQSWAREEVRFLKTFLKGFGVRGDPS